MEMKRHVDRGIFTTNYYDDGKLTASEFTPLTRNILTVLFIVTLIAAILFAGEWQRKEDAKHPLPVTVIRVIYMNGDAEDIRINAYPSKIWLISYKGSSTVEYLEYKDQVMSKTAASGVRRFEIISSNYKLDNGCSVGN